MKVTPVLTASAHLYLWRSVIHLPWGGKRIFECIINLSYPLYVYVCSDRLLCCVFMLRCTSCYSNSLSLRENICVCVGEFHYNCVFLSRLIFCRFKMRVRAERFPCRPGLSSCVCVCLRGSFPGFKSSLLSILTNLMEPNVTINIYFT